jgi:hypothetical protein
MDDEEYLNILNYGKPTGTISIQPHPEDVIDVDPEILNKMKSRLAGDQHLNAYNREDRVFDELELQREKQKLKRIFSSADHVCESFSSLKNIKKVRQELEYEKVNRELLKEYSFVVAHEKNVDEVDFYRWFLFGGSLNDKKCRMVQIKNCTGRIELFDSILNDYIAVNFELLSINSDMLMSSVGLLELFKKRELVPKFDQYIKIFYGATYEQG